MKGRQTHAKDNGEGRGRKGKEETKPILIKKHIPQYLQSTVFPHYSVGRFYIRQHSLPPPWKLQWWTSCADLSLVKLVLVETSFFFSLFVVVRAEGVYLIIIISCVQLVKTSYF